MINVAVVGAGFMGTMHCAVYDRFPERVRVHTVCSRTLEKAMLIAERRGADASDDVAATIRQTDVDLVDICLPTYLHRHVAEASFAAGKHVFLEKPIALTLEDADAILQAAAHSDRQLVVGLALRFWPEYRALEQQLRTGRMGRPIAVSTSRLSPPANWNTWMTSSKLSGGVAVDLLIHDFDQMNWLLGTPRRVFAAGPTQGAHDPAVHMAATVEYEGAIGVAEGSWALPNAYPFTSTIRVVCEEGAAEFRFDSGPPQSGGNIGGGDTASGVLRLFGPDGNIDLRRFAPHDTWEPEIVSLIDGIEQTRAPADGTGEQARAALALSLAANRSLRTGAVETVAS